ncbi:MAG: putative 2-aminoethylphosphonate ABC transporter permease subunit [Planctomycetota bacterium]|jgi:iron(III) transport system permease protein|nr:putative 2-aminoethylphosphonate ABC transporter permease subunit [Planctomycetota bacterium]MDR1520133.1 putative 2-aminoethylphosphonate ABC transporter permease subunit [Planctomycetota bacterium]
MAGPGSGSEALRKALLWGSVAFLGIGLALPLAELAVKSLSDADGGYAGFANFAAFFGSPSLSRALWNSIYVSVAATAITVPPAFAFAYAVTRTAMPLKPVFRQLAMLPLYAPSMLAGISLLYLFGKKGLITTGFFDRLPFLSADIGLYGSTGIILAEAILAFPPAAMILLAALDDGDARLYEAAESLGAGGPEIFWTVTIPGARHGLVSAAFVSFTMVFTDFGAPKVVGGNYPVLATDIYKHVVGQQNFNMGATVSLVMIAPTLLAFLADSWVRRRHNAAIGSRAAPLRPAKSKRRDAAGFVFCALAAGAILAVFASAGLASVVKSWPYNLRPGLWHYDFSHYGGGGYASFWNSLRLAAYSAVFGTALTFGSAYLIEKTRDSRTLRRFASLLSLVPLALPGLVIGLAYIFLFNSPSLRLFGLEIPNPLFGLYGTMALLVICNIVHFYTVGFLTASTALRQLDLEFEAAAESLAIPFYTAFLRVTLPICLPAVLDIAGFYFVSSMTTVSAVIFLYTPDTALASVAVVNMDDAGDTAAAAAMGMLIAITNIAVKSAFDFAARKTTAHGQAWRKR